MKKQLLVIILLFVSIHFLHAQWVSTYNTLSEFDNTPSFSKGIAIAVDNNNSCFITGYCSKLSSDNDILIAKYSASGILLWSRKYDGGIKGDDKAYGIVVDSYGSVYIVGSVSVSGKSYEVIVQKYNSEGNLQWQDIFGETNGTREDKGLNIDISQTGNIYVTGYTTGTDNKSNIFIRKYNSINSMNWFRIVNNPGQLNAKGYGIVVDKTDNIYITGYNNTDENQNDILAAKYNSKGTCQWITTYDYAHGTDETCSIDIDKQGNAYVSGFVSNANNNIDCAVLRFNSNGSFGWVKTENGNGNLDDKAYGIVVDETENAVIYTGYSTYNNKGSNYITARYKLDGKKDWIKTYDGPISGNDISHSLVVRENGNVIVTGESQGVNNDNDYATLEYIKSGDMKQVSRFSMSNNSDDIAMDVTIGNNGDVFVTGTSDLLVNFSTPQPFANTLRLNWGDFDINNSGPAKFNLSQNYPNPFNPVTNIDFTISENTVVKIKVYNILGQLEQTLIDKVLNTGTYKIKFDGSNLSSGTYFYELTAGDFRDIKKMILIK